nr:MAG TPA: head closure knob [Caudoviricetes sp.]
MIQSARNTKLNNNTNSALPNMSDVITDWFLDITFEVVERDMEGADWVETVTETIKTYGVVQPPSPKDLKIMPEGAWAWEWLTIHCLPDVRLNTNQYVKYDGKLYKVMALKDWSKYGYIKYTLLEAFRAEEEGL